MRRQAARILRGGFTLTLASLLALAVGTHTVAVHPVAAEEKSGDKAEQKNEKNEKNEKKARRKPNRLAKEKSPYLLQHAYNPVNWYPWGEEAIALARRDKKPIFLSIGYSTCHWCHVMERESFEDEEIAKFLNENFVCIKVDREERPDVDAVYMSAVHAMGRRGGWPLSVFMTPELKPFFGGTYFPPRDHPRRGMGFLSLIQRVKEVWGQNPEQLESIAERLTDHLKKEAKVLQAKMPLKPAILKEGFDWYSQLFDEKLGGFAGPPRHAPKFPRTSVDDFLLRYSVTPGAAESKTVERARHLVYATLLYMMNGGMYDHVGGGFHRYSTDRRWIVPHFEKMLYDQALITRSLCDVYRVCSHAEAKQAFRNVAERTMSYVLRRLRGKDGGLYSAEDADTNHVEGLTYTWQQEELITLLGKEKGESLARFFGCKAEGNFHEGGEHANVLHVDWDAAAKLTPALSEAQRNKNIFDAIASAEKHVQAFAPELAKMLAVRDKRPQPLLDDKVLTAWNGMGISALAQLYQITEDKKYLEAAQGAADFVLTRLQKDGKLQRRYRDGEARFNAIIDDYAFLIDGLLDLYESDFNSRWLKNAITLGRTMLAEFWDTADGGFFTTGASHEKLLVRQKEFYDGAIPSGNSVAFLDLLRLTEFTGDKTFKKAAEEMERVAAAKLGENAGSHPVMLAGAYYRLRGAREIVIVGKRDDALCQAMLREVRQRFLPAKIVVWVPSRDAANALAKTVPLAEAKLAIGGKTTAFVCRDGVCKLPAQDLATFRKQLDEG